MALVNAYVTLEQFNSWVQVDGVAKTDMAERAINAASRAIDEFCSRHFWQDGTVAEPVARTFETRSVWRLTLGEFNDLVSVDGVATDTSGDGTFDTTWDASDWELWPHNPPEGRPYTAIYAVAGRMFPVRYCRGRRARVQVTGVWGWEAVPAEVEQACLIKAARLFTRHQSPHGAIGIGDFAMRVSRSEDPDVVGLLEPFQHPASVMVA